MGLPPDRKLRAVFSELLKKIAERGFICPQIMRRSKLRDDPLGFIGPGCAKQLPRRGARQHGNKNITILTSQLIECENVICCLVPAEEIPSPASHVGRLLHCV